MKTIVQYRCTLCTGSGLHALGGKCGECRGTGLIAISGQKRVDPKVPSLKAVRMHGAGLDKVDGSRLRSPRRSEEM